MTAVSLSIISESGTPDRINEDGWVAIGDQNPPGWVAAAVIDGASVRALLPSLQRYLRDQGHRASPAVWATAIVRRALYGAFSIHPPASPLEALLAANRALRSALEAVPGMAEVYEFLDDRSVKPLPDVLANCTGSFSSELCQVFNSLFPTERWRALDARYLRLLLPACVITLVKLNISKGVFDFAHAGDTVLMRVNDDGELQLLSQDQMMFSDNQALQLALEAVRQRDNDVHSIIQAIEMVPQISERNRLNGLRHNYIDEQGHTQPDKGCGVVNGLAELGDYVQLGQHILAPSERLYLLSDGLTLPMAASNAYVPNHVRDDLAGWRQALLRGDLVDALEHVRHIESVDASRNLFPRFKQHDDATAVLIRVQ